jgi:hypothetical protein
MCRAKAPSLGSTEYRPTARHFHVWCLPAIGTLLFVGVWFLLWLVDQHGNRPWGLTGFVAGVGGSAGHRLTSEIGLLLSILALCMVNTLVLIAIGQCQDVLQVSKRILWFYAIIPLGSFACVVLADAKIPAYDCLALLLLMYVFLAVLILALLSCIFAPLCRALFSLRPVPRDFRESDQSIAKDWTAFLVNYAVALPTAVVLGANVYGRDVVNILFLCCALLLTILICAFLVQVVLLILARPRGTATLLAVSGVCWLVALPIVIKLTTRLSFGF